VVAAVLLAGGVVALNLRRAEPPGASDPVSVSVTQASRMELAREVESKRLVIEALLQSERRRAAGRELAKMPGPPAVALELERERAAGALMEYAAELRRRAAAREAGREYRKVIELFPDSALAMSARRGLENLEGVER
jgi:hypothetical protein